MHDAGTFEPIPTATASQPSATGSRVGAPVAHPAAETLRAYAADWRDFLAWCRQQRVTPLPARTADMAAYLLDAAPRLSRGALGRRRAAIRAMHRQHGFPLPALDRVAQAALRAAAAPAAPRKSTDPISPLLRIASACPRDLAGLRDRALLLLAAALVPPDRRALPIGAESAAPLVTRALLLQLDAEHVRFETHGATLQLKPRTDADGSVSRTLSRIIPAHAACPVLALESWLQASETRFGPVFRKIDRWGNVEHDRLGPDAWWRILARRSGATKPRRRRRAALG